MKEKSALAYLVLPTPRAALSDGLVCSVSILVMSLQSLGRQTLSEGHPASGHTTLPLL